MKALLTGITGNLGYEVFLDLVRRGITVVPCVRPRKKEALSFHPSKFEEVVKCDLTEEKEIEFSGNVDCIVHCAGVVHFREAEDKNEQMMQSVIKLAEKLNVPVYFISTAFVYRPLGTNIDFNNAYEKDKFNAEELLKKSAIRYGIFRPSVLTGHSRTGEIRNFNGFYLIVRAFIDAVRTSKTKGCVLRFPRMTGESNMVPVDQAAESIGKLIKENCLETTYITNPNPPRSEWVLDNVLNFYGVRDSVNIIDISFEEFGALNLTEEEVALYRLSSRFNPYWSMGYTLPPSVCTRNLIDRDYLMRALKFFHG
ncbi:MAG: SDR family oxidoreductase [Candidatus Taylorbacteria bacterium]|nr:SDR family oxidoreductase [Candidatus Taylorbacteria bacterium]